MEDDLVASGRFVRIVTRGRISGGPVPVVVGFAERPGGAVAVSAGSPDAAWALNLLREPACSITIADQTSDMVARPLGGAEHAAVVRDLILRYGTPSEGLGSGPSFLLEPVRPAGGAATIAAR